MSARHLTVIDEREPVGGVTTDWDVRLAAEREQLLYLRSITPHQERHTEPFGADDPLKFDR